MDESANILRNNSADLIDTPGNRFSTNRTLDATNKISANQKSPSKRASSETYKGIVRPAKMANLTGDLEKKQNQSEPLSERTNQLIMQSIERSKRRQSELALAVSAELAAEDKTISLSCDESKLVEPLKPQLPPSLDLCKQMTNTTNQTVNQTFTAQNTHTNGGGEGDSNIGRTSLIQGELPSMYFKPSAQHTDESKNELSFNRRTTWSIPTPSHNPFDTTDPNFALQAALASECFSASSHVCGDGSDIPFGEFRDAQDCVADLDRDEVHTHLIFCLSKNGLFLLYSLKVKSKYE